MLEKPDISDAEITDFVSRVYNLPITHLDFLPLGNDVNSAAYKITTEDNGYYFLKLRAGNFNESSVVIPKVLGDQGIDTIITPIPTRTSQLWSKLDNFKTILYPFIKGKSGFEIELSDTQWREFGDSLRRIHSAILPLNIVRRIPRETFSSQWREKVRHYLARIENEDFSDPIAAKLADFIKSRRQIIQTLINKAEETGNEIKEKNLEFVLCHADIHANNILVDTAGKIFIVDWDALILAPKERDLMFIGAGIGGAWNTRSHEELFYNGYGSTKINSKAIAYYRSERIVEDISEYCDRLLFTNMGGRDREKSLEKFMKAFSSNNVVEIALREAA